MVVECAALVGQHRPAYNLSISLSLSLSCVFKVLFCDGVMENFTQLWQFLSQFYLGLMDKWFRNLCVIAEWNGEVL